MSENVPMEMKVIGETAEEMNVVDAAEMDGETNVVDVTEMDGETNAVETVEIQIKETEAVEEEKDHID